MSTGERRAAVGLASIAASLLGLAAILLVHRGVVHDAGQGLPVATENCPLGMVAVPAGEAVVGTDIASLEELLSRYDPTHRDVFIHEAPQQAIFVPQFYIDQQEVSNAQYAVFLEATATAELRTPAGGATLADMVREFLRIPHVLDWDESVAARQLFRANHEVLMRVLPGLVARDGQRVDLARTESAFCGALVPSGVPLRFYDRRPPDAWPGTKPSAGQLDKPVTFVCYDDAEAFAEWAGKHIPTEIEWEYAARGPAAYPYPWGLEWYDDASRANWGGLVMGHDEEPALMPVNSLGNGASWCDARHLLGNAAEWTSSWFDAYPGSKVLHPWMGTYVKVIRGASYLDDNRLVLRCAARNFLGGGDASPPVPQNRFEAVGFRCARYMEPGASRLVPIARRCADRLHRIGVEMDAERYGAVVREPELAQQDLMPNGVRISERSHAVVVVPLHRLATETRVELGHVANAPASPLAIVHSDLPPEGAVGNTWILMLEDGRLVLVPPGQTHGGLRLTPSEDQVVLQDRIVEADLPPATVEIDLPARRVLISCQTLLPGDDPPGGIIVHLRRVALPLSAQVPDTGTWARRSAEAPQSSARR